MATYCMSDLHGKRALFHAMLDQISFGSSDRLFVIGDVIDRGSYGVELLQEILEMPNAVLLLGNHEFMMRDWFRPSYYAPGKNPWGRNGNRETLAHFLQLPEAQQKYLLDQLEQLPDGIDLQVNGRTFCLIHGFPGENTHDAVWGRPIDLEMDPPLPGRQLIIGHTPVPNLLCRTDAEQGAYFRRLERTGEHIEILHAKAFIDLDCGCGHRVPGAALGCLRLDDLQEFYVPDTPGNPE